MLERSNPPLITTTLLCPLYFVRSGNIYIYYGRFGSVGDVGYAWSSNTLSRHYNGSISPSARYLVFMDNKASYLGGPDDRWLGLPLRWLGSEGRNRKTGSLVRLMGGLRFGENAVGTLWHAT